MSTTTTSGTRHRITKGSSPFAPGATIAGKQVERWFPLPSAAPVAQHLDRPLRWGKPRHGILTNDLFDGSLSNEAIAAVFGVMLLAKQHTFQILTKRPERARGFFDWISANPLFVGESRESADRLGGSPAHACLTLLGAKTPPELAKGPLFTAVLLGGTQPKPGAPIEKLWPLPNVWLGVSVENQATADERIPLLLQTPAAKRFVSYEPALGPVSFRWMCAFPENAPRTAMKPGGATNHLDGLRRLDWVIVGGESGPGARPFDVAWARSTVEQCREAGVACFVKQLGARPIDASTGENMHTRWTDPDGHGERIRHPKGGDWFEWPEDLRVREFPR